MSLQRLFETLGPLSYFTITCVLFLLFGLLIGWLLWWSRSRQYKRAASDWEIVKHEVGTLAAQNRELSIKGERSTRSTRDQEVDAMKSVSLTGLENVSPEMASQLEGLGVSNLADLESMSESARNEVEAKMSATGQSWDWKWVEGWKSQAGIGLAGVSAAGIGAVVTDTAVNAGGSMADVAGRVKGIAGAKLDAMKSVSLSGLENVSPEMASQLEGLGVRNLADLESMPESARNEVEATMSASGQPWDWKWVDDWKSKAGIGLAGANAAGIKLPEVDGPTVDWNKIDGIDPRVATRLGQLGIRNIEQLENLSGEDREVIEAKLSLEGTQWDWNWIHQWKEQVVSNPSIVECDSPTEVSSSTTLSAADHASKIDRKASRSRWGFGASLFGRLSGEKSGESSSSDQSSTTKGASRDVDDSTETRVLGFSSGSDSQPVSDPVSMDPSVLPKFDLGIPRVKDDLTLLDGIGSEQTEALHQMGIHDFDHLHDLSSVNRKRLQAYFQYRGWHLDMDQWRIASEGNTKDPTMEEIQQKAYEVYLYRDQHGLHGWEKSDWDQAEWQLRGNPSFAIGIPHHVDDFVETAKITPEAREELYRMGLYHHGQIDALDTKERRMLARWFAGPRFGIDITSAFNWLSSLKSVPPRNYGETHLNRPDSVDDLTDINGIGPATERELNRIGVFQLLQIAQWDEENVRSVSETLHFEDRIQTDMWVVQAQRLAGTS